jgi:hypothetical protein
MMDVVSAGIALIVVGLLIALLGKVFYRISIAIIGFGIGFILVSEASREFAPDLSLVFSIAGGIIGVFLMSFIHKLSVFVLGASAAVAAMSVFFPAPTWLLIGGVAVVGGIIGMVLEKQLIAVGTSLIGAYTCVTGTVLLVNRPIFGSSEDLWLSSYRGELIPRDPLYIFLFFAIWGLGLFVQLRSKSKRDGK